MSDASSWVVFVVASVALLVTPGPSVLFIVARSLDQGRRAGLVSVAGIALGTLGHVAAATLGVSALVASSATLFTMVKLVGAAYLVWMGVQRMLGRGAAGAATTGTAMGMGAVFRQGALVNLLNPKTALFFLAFLPQFVDASRPVAQQLLALGLVFTALALASDSLFALLAGGVHRWLRAGHAPRFVRAQRYVSGGVFIALGVSAALARRAA